MAKLVIADDHPLFRNALIQTLNNLTLGLFGGQDETNLKHEIIEACDFESTVLALDTHPDTDILLLDLNMPGNETLLGLVRIRKRFPAIPVIVVSATEDVHVLHKAMTYGASAYIPKSSSPAQISEALKAVIAGDVWLPQDLKQAVLEKGSPEESELISNISELTQQQYRVLSCLVEGMLNKQIAHDMGITEATVKAHMTAIFRKLGVYNRTQVVIQMQPILSKLERV